VTHLALTR